MNYHPPVSFHFKVYFHDRLDDPSGGQQFGSEFDIRFQSVSGLNAEMEVENYREGGENRFEHILPNKAKYSDLVLKRGLSSNSELIRWCTDTFENFLIRPKNLFIDLLNENGDPLLTWYIDHAWPKKWSVSDLNAENSELAIETLELHYRFFNLQ